MSEFQTVEIPFLTLGNRQVLTGLQIMQHPWLREFVERFPDCFAAEYDRDVLVFYPDGDAPRNHPG